MTLDIWSDNYDDFEPDTEYRLITPPSEDIKGHQCGLCGKKFDYGAKISCGEGSCYMRWVSL